MCHLEVLFSGGMIKHNVLITIVQLKYDMLPYAGLDHGKGTVFESVSKTITITLTQIDP